MTKYTNRATLLASGAREVTMEELDWVRGGDGVSDSSAISGAGWQNYNGVSVGNGAYVDSGGMISIIATVGSGPHFGTGGGFSFGAEIPSFTGIGFLSDAELAAIAGLGFGVVYGVGAVEALSAGVVGAQLGAAAGPIGIAIGFVAGVAIAYTVYENPQPLREFINSSLGLQP